MILCNVKICPDFLLKSTFTAVKSRKSIHTCFYSKIPIIIVHTENENYLDQIRVISKFGLECKNINKQIDNLPVPL